MLKLTIETTGNDDALHTELWINGHRIAKAYDDQLAVIELLTTALRTYNRKR